MNPDFVDLLRAFTAADVRFLIVGAYALAFHGHPRATGDLDVWIDAQPENAARVMRALATFGAPLQDVTAEAFAWQAREAGRFGDVEVHFIGRDAFIRNKKATGRLKDVGDIEGL